MKLPDRAGGIDGADYLARLLRWFRPRLSAGSALTAALTTGLDPSVDYSPTAAALRLLADRASEIDADIAAVRGLAKEPPAPMSLAGQLREIGRSLKALRPCIAARTKETSCVDEEARDLAGEILRIAEVEVFGPSPAEVLALLRSVRWIETDEADVICVGCRTAKGHPCFEACKVDATIKRLEALPVAGPPPRVVP